MKTADSEQLKREIAHIFESGANEIRIYEMVELFIKRRFETPRKHSTNRMKFLDEVVKEFGGLTKQSASEAMRRWGEKDADAQSKEFADWLNLNAYASTSINNWYIHSGMNGRIYTTAELLNQFKNR